MFDIREKNHESLKTISLQDFLNLGMHDTAYIKPIVLDEKQVYAVHAADGTPLSVMENMSDAVMAIHQNDLTTAALH